MKVLVTGAAGFLGSHVVDACLAGGHRVRAIVRPSSDTSYLSTRKGRVDMQVGPCTDPDFLDRALTDIDAVIHSAARVSEMGPREAFHESNVGMTESLLCHARTNRVTRFVHVSSPSVVAERKDQVNIDERYPYPRSFLNLYCETKAIAEQMVLRANGEGFVTCALRPRAVWGPRDWRGPFAKFLKLLRQEKLRNLSGGKRVMTSICYVKNAAQACVNALTAKGAAGNVYFVADPEPVNLWEFVDFVAETFSLPPVTGSFPPAAATALASLTALLWRIPHLRDNVAPPLTPYALGMITYCSTYDVSRAQRDRIYHDSIALHCAMEEYKAWVDEIGGVDAYLSHVC